MAVSGLEMSQNSLYQPGHERAWTSASMTSWKVYTTLVSNTARPKMEVTSITSSEQILEASSKLLNQCLNKELFGELFCIDLRFNVRTSIILGVASPARLLHPKFRTQFGKFPAQKCFWLYSPCVTIS